MLFETGTFEGFNDGGWWGYMPALVPGNAQPVYPFVDNQSVEQSTNKIVYLSPTIRGFQFATGFTPNQSSMDYSPAVTSQPIGTALSGGMAKNIIDIGGQYTKSYGLVGIQVGVDYMYAGQVANAVQVTERYATPSGYKNLNMFSGGATATIAGVTFGGNVVYGAFNQVSGYTFQLQPDGGKPAIGWLAGAQYAAGPLTIGASYFQFDTTGDLPGGIDAGSGATISSAGLTAGQQHNVGLAVGATYTLVPGFDIFLDYDYGTRHQGGLDFSNDYAGTAHNDTQAQVFGLGTQVQW